TRAVLTPAAPLATSTSYTAHLTTALRSSDGVALAAPVQWTLTTAAAPLTVTAHTPADGATAVATTATVTATFSRALDPASLTIACFTLTTPTGSTTASLHADVPTTSPATLTPAAPLATSASYTAHLTTALHTADGA